MKVKTIMAKDLTALEGTETVRDLIFCLNAAGMSSVPVVNADGQLIGIISERDIIEAALPRCLQMLHSAAFIPNIEQFSKKLTQIADDPLEKYMRRDVISIDENEDDLHAADLIVRNNLRNLPVVNGERILVGVISRIDLLRHLL